MDAYILSDKYKSITMMPIIADNYKVVSPDQSQHSEMILA